MEMFGFTKASLYLENNSHWNDVTGLGFQLDEILENDYFFPTVPSALEAVLCDNLLERPELQATNLISNKCPSIISKCRNGCFAWSWSNAVGGI